MRKHFLDDEKLEQIQKKEGRDLALKYGGGGSKVAPEGKTIRTQAFNKPAGFAEDGFE